MILPFILLNVNLAKHLEITEKIRVPFDTRMIFALFEMILPFPELP